MAIRDRVKAMSINKKIIFRLFLGVFADVLLLLALIGCYIYYKVKIASELSVQFQLDLSKYIATIFIIVISILLSRVVNVLVEWYKNEIAQKTATTLDDELMPLLNRTLKIVIWGLAILIILPFYGVNISALVAALGIGSLAIALAAQDTIANIIAGFLIMIDRPFRLGDKIKLPTGEIVEVINIGIRRSKFLSEDKKAIVIVPNVDLSKNKIVNFTLIEDNSEKSK